MRFTETLGQEVVSTSTAMVIGKIKSFVVDPQSSSVLALILKKTSGDADLLLYTDLIAFGPDAVTVESEAKLCASSPTVDHLLGKDHELKKKRVLTETGKDLGTVRDVEFDPDTGRVTALTTNEVSIEGSGLIGIGSYAVVVAAPPETETAR